MEVSNVVFYCNTFSSVTEMTFMYMDRLTRCLGRYNGGKAAWVMDWMQEWRLRVGDSYRNWSDDGTT